MRFSFSWPPPDDTAWLEEAAEKLVGQETLVDGKLATIIDCRLADEGHLEVTIQTKEDVVELYNPIGHIGVKNPLGH